MKDKDYENTKKVYKELGKKYLDSIESIDVDYFREFIDSLPKGGLVLDVGCAGGRDAEKLSKEGFKVVGIDFVEDFIDESRKRLPEVDFRVMDMMRMDFGDEAFDGIWASAVIVHIKKEDIPRVLNEYSRVLKGKGCLYLYVKKGKGTVLMNDKLSQVRKRLFSFFEKDELEEFLNDGGFKIIKSKVFNDHAGRDLQWIAVIAKKK